MHHSRECKEIKVKCIIMRRFRNYFNICLLNIKPTLSLKVVDWKNITEVFNHMKVENSNLQDVLCCWSTKWGEGVKLEVSYDVVRKLINWQIKVQKAIFVEWVTSALNIRWRLRRTAKPFKPNQTRGIDLSNKPKTKAVRPTVLLAHFVTYTKHTSYLRPNYCAQVS